MKDFNWSTRPIAFALLLAMASAGGIVALLLFDDGVGRAALLLVAVPVLLGLWRYVVAQKT